jgi:hypothetical protein
VTWAAIEQPQVLVGRRLDGWLTGWIAVALWGLAWLAVRGGHPIGTLELPSYWPLAAVSAMHFGASYHLAYTDTAAVRRRPFSLLIAPTILAATLVVVVVVAISGGGGAVRDTTRGFLTSVYLLSTWHYIKQVYGVARLGARYRGMSLTPNEVRVLRFSLYPLWFIGAGMVAAKGVTSRYAGFELGLDLVPTVTFTVLRFVAVACAGSIVVVLYRIGRRYGALPPAMMIAPYLAAFLWLLVPPDYFTTTVALGALHGLQYIACCQRAEGARAPWSRSGNGLLRWLEIFGGAACGGLLLTTWLPQLLNRVVAVDGSPLLFTAVFFVFLNLHHYLIDAVIWRSNGQIVRSMTDRSHRASPRMRRHPVDLATPTSG